MKAPFPRKTTDPEISELRISDELLTTEFHGAERERKKRAVKARRLQQLLSHASFHALRANPELIPPHVYYPEITAGEIVVIYGGPDVDLSGFPFQMALAAAEGPSPDFDNQRTKSGRDLTLGLQCRKRCHVQIMALHCSWHRFLASLRPYLAVATSAGFARRLSWSCPDATPQRTWEQDFDEPTPPTPLDLQQDFDLIVYDLSDIDDRMTGDYAAVEKHVSRYRNRNALDRPTVVFVIREDVLRRTWPNGVWNGCDRVLRAQPVTEEGSEQTIQLVAEQFSSLLDTHATGRETVDGALSGSDGRDTSQPKGRTSLLTQVVELYRAGKSDADMVRILKCDRTTIWRNKATARKRGLIRDDDE